MRSLLLSCTLLAAAVPLCAQEPKLELRGVMYGMPTHRTSALDPTTVAEASGTMSGGELSVRLRYVGLMMRIVNGSLTTTSGSAGAGGKLTMAEARAQLGPRIVALEGGYVRRAMGGSLGTTVYSFVRAGAASIIDIGASGFSARLSAGVYVAGQGARISGQEVVTALEYHARRLPVVLTLGYRAEVFQVSGGGVDRPERVSGILLGGGISVGH